MRLEQAIQSTKFHSPVQKAAVNILYTAWWLKTLVNGQLKPFGLTHEQYNVLRILRGKHPQPMCIKDIAGRLIEKNSNVPRIVTRLAAKKWVHSGAGANDRRETVVQLTAAGEALLEAATHQMQKEMEQRLLLPAEDAVALNSMLERLRGES